MQKDNNYKKQVGLYQKVYCVVSMIPKGKVATYGQIAKLIGTRDARKVGWALSGNKSSQVPCHRVVNKEGELAENFGKSLPVGEGWGKQKRKLLLEGVAFVDEKRVDLKKHQWEEK